MFIRGAFRRGGRDVELPYCVTLVLHAGFSSLFLLVSFFSFFRCLCCFSRGHDTSASLVTSMSFCTINRFSGADRSRFLSLYRNHSNIPEKYCLTLSFVLFHFFFFFKENVSVVFQVLVFFIRSHFRMGQQQSFWAVNSDRPKFQVNFLQITTWLRCFFETGDSFTSWYLFFYSFHCVFLQIYSFIMINLWRKES